MDVVAPVDGDHAVEAVDDADVVHQRGALVAGPVPVDRVAGEYAELTHVVELGVRHAQRAVFHDHDMAAELRRRRVIRASDDDVVRQQADLGPLLDRAGLAAGGLGGDYRRVPVGQRPVDRDCSAVRGDPGDRDTFLVVHVEVGGGDDDQIAGTPRHGVDERKSGGASVGRL